MECEKCKTELSLYGDYKELRTCENCGREYVILQGKPKLLSGAEFRRIKTMIDKAEENKEKLRLLFKK